MGRDESSGLPDLGQVSTAEELATALKQLLKHLNITGAKVAEKATLGNGTISEAINGKTFPRRDTVHDIVKVGCGQDPKPWLDAWERAKKDKRKKASVEEVAEQLEIAESRIESLESALRDAVARIDSLESEISQLRAGSSAATAEADRRARTDAASDRALEALRALKTSGGRGVGEGDHAWMVRRNTLIDALHFASLDIGNRDLRDRLTESIDVLKLWGGPKKYADWSEFKTRHLAIEDAMESTGAYRRRDELPDRSADFLQAREFALMYLDEMESN